MGGSITEKDDSMEVMEGSTMDSIDIVLVKAPDGDVTVSLHPTVELDMGEGAGFVVEWLKCTDPLGTGYENLN